MRLLTLCLAALACAACQTRLPLSRAEAASSALNWCVRENKAWGDPVEITKPGEADAEGRRFWTVRFAAQPGENTVLLVNAANGWSKPAPAPAPAAPSEPQPGVY